MAFPLSYSTVVSLASAAPQRDAAAALVRVQDWLRGRRADTVPVGQLGLTFRVPFGRAGWDILAGIDGGRAYVSPSVADVQAVAEFSFKRFFIISGTMAAVLGVLATAFIGLAAAVLVAALAWAWIFGANYALSVSRLRSRFARVVHGEI
jgi:Flp pilus assembly protein TadB